MVAQSGDPNTSANYPQPVSSPRAKKRKHPRRGAANTPSLSRWMNSVDAWVSIGSSCLEIQLTHQGHPLILFTLDGI